MYHRAKGAALAAAGCLVLAGCGGSTPSTAGVSPSAASTTEPDFYDSPAPVTTTSSPTTIWAAPTSTAPATTEASPAATATSGGGCSLPHTGDLLLWEKWPGTPVQVMTIGDVDLLKCKYTWETLADTEPSGPGYCDILFRASDNPHYDMNELPRPRPKNILAQAGAGC